MKTHSYVTNVSSRSDVCYLVPLGCSHIGAKNCDKVKLKEQISWVKETPNVYVLGMGDYADHIAYSDKRFDPTSISKGVSLDNIFDDQTEQVAEIFMPIKDRIMGLVEGNHEDAVRIRYHYSPCDKLAKLLNTINLTYTSMIRWEFKRGIAGSTVVIYASHGWGTSKSAMNKLVGMSKSFDADIYLAGHVHTKDVKETDRLFIPKKGDTKILKKKQLFGITGTYLKCYEDGVRNYGERPGYDPTPMGSLKIRIEPFRQQRGCVVPHIHISL